MKKPQSPDINTNMEAADELPRLFNDEKIVSEMISHPGRQLYSDDSSEVPDFAGNNVMKNQSELSMKPKDASIKNTDICICEHDTLRFEGNTLKIYCDDLDHAMKARVALVDLTFSHPHLLENLLNHQSKVGNIAVSSNLNKHMKVHTQEKPFKCSLCNYNMCSDLSSLKIHMMVHTRVKPFMCSVCGIKFAHQYQRKVHMTVHTGEKLLMCSVCGNKYARRSYLNLHMMVHTREKPVKCSLCGYICTQSSTLKRHMRVHTGEKPFACPLCDHKCTNRGNLKRHMVVHTQERFICSVCGHSYSRIYYLKKHMRLHTGEKVYSLKSDAGKR